MIGERSAFIFINVDQAAGFGHIGWGFHIGGDRFYYGSTDHLWRPRYPYWHVPELFRYMNVAPQGNNDYWAKIGKYEEMLTEMRIGRHVRYHKYKIVTVPEPNPLTAKAYADSRKTAGWNVAANNCVHQSYHILTTYGAELPCPYQLIHRFPKTWFGKISAPQVMLKPLPRIDSSESCIVTPTEINVNLDRRAG